MGNTCGSGTPRTAISYGPLPADPLSFLDEIQLWQKARGQKFSQPAFDLASRAADAAVKALNLSPSGPLEVDLLDHCAQMGYLVRIIPQPHPVLGRKMRARIDLAARTLEVFQPALEDLADRLAEDTRNLALPLVIAHELFHALDPKCSEPELAAHLFAARICSAPLFPGFLDL
jgi:hypothetical protein